MGNTGLENMRPGEDMGRGEKGKRGKNKHVVDAPNLKSCSFPVNDFLFTFFSKTAFIDATSFNF